MWVFANFLIASLNSSPEQSQGDPSVANDVRYEQEDILSGRELTEGFL